MGGSCIASVRAFTGAFAGSRAGTSARERLGVRGALASGTTDDFVTGLTRGFALGLAPNLALSFVLCFVRCFVATCALVLERRELGTGGFTDFGDFFTNSFFIMLRLYPRMGWRGSAYCPNLHALYSCHQFGKLSKGIQLAIPSHFHPKPRPNARVYKPYCSPIGRPFCKYPPSKSG